MVNFFGYLLRYVDIYIWISILCSGDGRSNGDLSPLQEPFPARESEGAAGEGALEATPLSASLEAASPPAKRRSSTKRQ